MEQPKIKRVLYTEQQLMSRVSRIGRQIDKDYKDSDLILVSVLKGSLYFVADLTRAITIPIRIDCISIGMYSSSSSEAGIVRIIKDLDLDITNKHVLIVEDAVRTGLTIGYLVQNFTMRKPKSVKVCSLFVNPDQLLISLPIAYTGFEVHTDRLIGYGADINERWRNLPYVAEIEKD